jgi:dienelactone hydrolase
MSSGGAARAKELRSLPALALVATLGLGAAACSSGGGSASGGPPAQTSSVRNQPAPTRVVDRKPGHTSWKVTFVDTSRRTVPKTGAALPSRTLVTTIYRPNGNGPFPLILFSHGSVGHPDKFTKLFSVWADAGFAVAAPAFPLTNGHATDPVSNLGDVVHQAPDISFVLDKILALDRQPGSRLFRAINEHRIGASGLSLGGVDTYLLVYSVCCRDSRITAVAVLDGARPNVPLDGHVPLLIAHSDTDPVIPYASALAAFKAAKGPAWLVTLHGASHASQWENDVTPYDHIAEQMTSDFWDATLNGNAPAFARLQRDATVSGLSSILVKR